MKIWLLSQTENGGYDTYDSCVVAAPDEESAKKIHPGTCDWEKDNWMRNWASKPENVSVLYLGEAKDGLDAGAILASFNAG